MSPVLKRRLAGLFVLTLGLQVAHAQPAKSPRRLIEGLGLEVRAILADPKPGRTPEDAERVVAEQIAALARSAPGHLSLTDADLRGNTPLMLAASDAYPLVVQALLEDPGVRLQINVTDKAGHTAWMLARFAPSMTLVACQPGMLTRDRSLLLPPYLRRMSHLLKTRAAAVDTIVKALEAAGAEIKSDEELRRAWLKRCPNARPELREALATRELTSALVNEAVTQQLAFNQAGRDRPKSLPAQPPEGMRFVTRRSEGPGVPAFAELLALHDIRCPQLPKPTLPQVNWTGTVQFKVVAAARAGIIETADFELLSPKEDPRVVDLLRMHILSALSRYECEGDHVFEQTFQYRID